MKSWKNKKKINGKIRMKGKGENKLKKKNIFYYSCQTVTVILVSLLLSITSINAQEEVVTVSDSSFTTHSRPPVTFLHDQHNEDAEIENCNLCHHIYENGQLVEDESSEDMECSECHNKGGDDKLARIYHITCKGCHIKEKTGPLICVECHKK